MARSDPKTSVTTSLKAALKLAGMVIERRNTTPVLNCIRLTAPGLIEATDLDMFLAVNVDDVEFGRSGVVIQHRPLAAAVNDTDGSLIVEENKDGRCVRVGDNPSARIAASKDDLPDQKAFDMVAEFELPVAELAVDLAHVSPAMSDCETRYYLQGIFCYTVDGQLRFAATDGHRLHRVARPLPSGATKLPDSIIPRKAIRLLAELIAAQPKVATVKVEVGTLKARFIVGAATLSTRLIDGTFPDYKRVIPNVSGGMKLAAQELIRPATLARSLMGKSSAVVIVRPKDGIVTAKSPEGFEMEARLDRELVGEPVEQIGFRHEYLVDALTPFLGRDVTLSAADAAAPCRIEVEGDERLLVVLMPMRV